MPINIIKILIPSWSIAIVIEQKIYLLYNVHMITDKIILIENFVFIMNNDIIIIYYVNIHLLGTHLLIL